MSGEVPLAARQGPIDRPAEAPADGWVPLSQVTREALKPVHDSPWGDLFTWRTRSRPQGVAGLDVDGRRRATEPARPVPGGVPRRHRRGAVRGPDRRRPLRRGVRRRRGGQSRSRRCAAGSAPRRARSPAVEACWTSRSRSGPSSASRPSTARFPRSSRRRCAAPSGWRSSAAGPPACPRPGTWPASGYPVTVLEAMPVPGGMMAIGIPEYRLPRDVLQEEIARILAVGVELRLDTAMGRDFGLADLEREGFRAIFLATGASKSRRLGVPGDELRGVIPATRFLKEVNLGESPRLSGDVVVVGGGSTAMDAARSARRSGAATVTIVYRRGRRDMPAQAEEIEAAEREGIVVLDGLAPDEVVGRDGAVVGRSLRRHARARRRGRRPAAPAGRRRARSASSRRARSSSPSARSPTRRSCPRVPASRSAAGPGSSPIRGPSPRAGPGSSRAATSCRGRARSSRRSPPDAAPRRRSTSTSRVRRTARRRSSRPCGTGRRRRPRSAVDLVGSSAGPRGAAGRRHRVVLGHGAGLHRRRGACRGRPVLPVRRGVRLPVRPGRGRPRSGRRARGPRP